MDSVTIQKLLVSTQEDIVDLTNMSDIHFNRILIALVFVGLFAITFFYVDYQQVISLILLCISIIKSLYEIAMFSFIRYSIRHKTKNYSKLIKLFTDFENESAI